VQVNLWDLSGAPEYIDVRNELYGQTDAVFLVFDVTNQASFESLETWIKEVNKYSGGVQEIVLVANKVWLHDFHHFVMSSSDWYFWFLENI
jgi:DnaJ family protein C protein 27